MSVVSLGRICAAVSLGANIAIGAVVNAQEAYFDSPEQPQSLSRSPMEEKSLGGMRALLLHSDRDYQVQGFEDALVATGKFGGADIDQFDMLTGIPSLEFLQQYDCVYAYVYFNTYARNAAGNVLKQYVDNGGGVILAPAAFGRIATGHPMLGGIVESTYSPLTSTNVQILNSPRALEFASANAADMLLDGVTEFEFGIAGANFIAPGLDPTADLVAVDNEGVNLLAISRERDVVGINVFPGVTPAIPKSAGVFRTFANACDVVGALHVDVGGGSNNGAIVLNLKSNGVVTVLIYGSDLFDVIEIDTSTLTFADAGVKIVGKKNNELCTVNDFDNDGYDDLSCKFNTVDLGQLDGSSTEAQLKGRLTDGSKFVGSAEVIVVQD